MKGTTMAKISKEDVAGMYRNDGSIICTDCMTDEDWNMMTADDVITREDVDGEETLFFCDLCKKQL
ncbi:MAG: hypothetical protein ABFD66_07705 [Smithella sp.]